MAISPMYFQILSPDQANPLGYGFQQGTQSANNILQARTRSLLNQQTAAQLPYAGQQAQQDLLKSQLANALQQNTLNYAPQTSAAELASKQAMPAYYSSETQKNNADTGLINQQAKYLPLDSLIKAQQANQSNNRFGQYYQLAKSLDAMPTPARATWIANNQDTYNQMLATLGNGNAQQSYLTPQVMQQFFPGLQGQSPSPQQPAQAMPTQQAPQQPMQQPMQQPTQTSPQVGMPQRPVFAMPTPAQNSQVALANQMAANKGLTTNATQRQMEGAIQVEGIMNDPGFQQQVQDASNYAGALRKGSAAVDALSQNNPKAYENYIALKNQTMPLLLNRIKTLDSMGATDKQREDLENLYSSAMNSLTSNPAQFVTQINKLGQTLDTISRSVQKSATPISPVNRLSGYQPIGGSSNNMPAYFNTGGTSNDLSNVPLDVLQRIASQGRQK